MSTKITFRTILFMAVLLLIIPVILSAAGNREAENEKGITLDTVVMEFLIDLEKGKPLETVKSEFLDIEKEYKVSEDQRELVLKMMDEVNSKDKTSDECQEQLQKQLQISTRTRERTITTTPKGEPVMTRSESAVQKKVNNQ